MSPGRFFKEKSGHPSPPPGWGARAVLGYGLLAAIAVFFLGRYLLGVQATARAPQQGACLALQPVEVMAPAPPFELPDLRGKKTSLASLRGKVVLLNFWATWCPPCLEELPSLIELGKDPPGRGFTLLTVSVDERADDVRKLLAKRKALLALPVLLDPSRRVPASFGTSKFPETYLIDARGQVRYRFINKRDWSSFAARECIASLVP